MPYPRITGVEDVIAHFAEVHEALALAAQVMATAAPTNDAPTAIQPVPSVGEPQSVQPLPAQPSTVHAPPAPI